MTRKISQREARSLKKRVKILEAVESQRRTIWAEEWPGGTTIGSVTLSVSQAAVVRTARRLRHAVVIGSPSSDSDVVRLFALPLAVQS